MYKFLCLPLFIFISPAVLSQTTQADSSLLHVYRAAVKNDPQLYNGRQYLYPYRDRKGHPFLFTDTPLRGSLYYDGGLFNDIMLSYDIVTDELLLYPDNSGTQVLLQKERIPSFRIGQHHFMQLYEKNKDSVSESIGYFELLREGKELKAFVKHEKILVDPGANSGEQPGFQQKENYFIQKNGRLLKIKSQNNLLNMLPSGNEAIKQYVNNSGLDFKKDPAGVMIKIIEAFNGLSNNSEKN